MKSRAIKTGLTCGALCLPLIMFAWGCAPQASGAADASDSKDGSGSAAVEVAWTPQADCSSCHEAEAATVTDTACLAGHHTSTQGFECVTCHADESALTEVHQDMSNGKVPKKLKKTEVDQALCLSCHDLSELAEKTASSAVLVDDNGKAVNPHDLPQNEEHAAATCTSCHKGHDTEGVQETAPSFCISCHHANVYECGTCHE